ncbi:MAG TPA: glycoside hydrolase family 97 protein [Terracidiphilus sp.]|jgi:alpha-glucosidase
MRFRCPFFFVACFFCVSLLSAQEPRLQSPNGELTIRIMGDSLRYTVEFHSKQVLAESPLGLKLEGQSPLGPGMRQTHVATGHVDETYTIPVGKTSSVRNDYNWMRVDFEDAKQRKLSVEARAYDDGVAFRLLVPEQAALKRVHIAQELTGFEFSTDVVTYPLLLDGFQSSYEDEYQSRLVSGLHKDWLIGLPLLLHLPGVAWMGITEADIDNYAGMYLRKATDQRFALRAELSPRMDHPEYAVDTQTPFATPWRALMIGDEPGRLVESNLVLNLNPASKIEDTSWIKAGKSAWDWWSGDFATGVDFKPGMNTATMKHYIDFASQSGFSYMLIDAGWAVKAKDVPGNIDHQDEITRVQPDVDMPELLRYAKEKNVRIWLWSHWTSVDKYMEQAFPMYEKWGVAGVKIDFMQRDDQEMVNWYRKVVETAARYHLMIDFHGAFKPDGLRRIYPNLVTREAVMGKEYVLFSARVTPVHDTTLPFTRMLAGPLDYTPGAFDNVTRDQFAIRRPQPMAMNTRAHELALYVVLESPFQMVSDYPEQYKGQHDFEFLKQVPASWDEVRVLDGLPMQNITIARRSGKAWYVGAITNWDARTVSVPLSFLPEGRYTAEIYADAPDAGTNPMHTAFSKQAADKSTVLELKMASGGGGAVWIHPAD